MHPQSLWKYGTFKLKCSYLKWFFIHTVLLAYSYQICSRDGRVLRWVRHKESFATRETEEFYDRGWGVEVAAAFPKYKYKRVRRDSYIFWANPVCTSAVCIYIYFCGIGIWSFPNSIAKRNTHGGIHQTLTPNIKGNSLCWWARNTRSLSNLILSGGYIAFPRKGS